jgi:hypothetical protein
MVIKTIIIIIVLVKTKRTNIDTTRVTINTIAP